MSLQMLIKIKFSQNKTEINFHIHSKILVMFEFLYNYVLGQGVIL